MKRCAALASEITTPPARVASERVFDLDTYSAAGGFNPTLSRTGNVSIVSPGKISGEYKRVGGGGFDEEIVLIGGHQFSGGAVFVDAGSVLGSHMVVQHIPKTSTICVALDTYPGQLGFDCSIYEPRAEAVQNCAPVNSIPFPSQSSDIGIEDDISEARRLARHDGVKPITESAEKRIHRVISIMRIAPVAQVYESVVFGEDDGGALLLVDCRSTQRRLSFSISASGDIGAKKIDESNTVERLNYPSSLTILGLMLWLTSQR